MSKGVFDSENYFLNLKKKLISVKFFETFLKIIEFIKKILNESDFRKISIYTLKVGFMDKSRKRDLIFLILLKNIKWILGLLVKIKDFYVLI